MPMKLLARLPAGTEVTTLDDPPTEPQDPEGEVDPSSTETPEREPSTTAASKARRVEFLRRAMGGD